MKLIKIYVLNTVYFAKCGLYRSSCCPACYDTDQKVACSSRGVELLSLLSQYFKSLRGEKSMC